MLARAALLLSLLPGAAGYAALAEDAKPVRNLGRLLADYLEDCSVDAEGFDRGACEERVKEARRAADGELLKVEVRELAGLLDFAGWDERKDAYRVHLVPMLDARGLGLSVGKPRRLDAKGRPVIQNVPIWVGRPEGEPELIFKRRFERGMVRLELLVEPQGAWRLRNKGGADVRGMRVKLRGLRLMEARSGKVLAEQTYGRR